VPRRKNPNSLTIYVSDEIVISLEERRQRGTLPRGIVSQVCSEALLEFLTRPASGLNELQERRAG
jgi:hypothetical protein